MRLSQVTASGETTLVTRGTLALDSESPLVALGAREVRIAAYGNLMEMAGTDTLRLDITNVDSPYIAPSRVPSVTRISKVSVAVPVRPTFR